MTSANASGKVALDSCGWDMFVSLCNLAFRIDRGDETSVLGME